MKKSLIIGALALCFAFQAQADLLLQPNDRVAICGGGDYSIYLESYLYGSQVVPGIEVEAFDNIGSPAGVSASLNNGGLGAFKPTVVTTNFGGDPATYAKDQADMVAALKKAGVRLVVVNAPANAATGGMVYADVDGAISAATAEAKALFGDQYTARAGWPEALSLAAGSRIDQPNRRHLIESALGF
jgi:hypothetical protein